MRRGYRRERIEREIFRQVSLVLQTEMRDPRIGVVTLTRVEVSPDFSFARVYVGSLDGKADAELLRVLSGARKFIRARLQLPLRKAPDLMFVFDPGLQNALRVEQTLERLRQERERKGQDS